MSEEEDNFPIGLGVEQARARIVAAVQACKMPAESVDVRMAAGRILAQDAHATCDIPGFANSAMDGFAFRGMDLPTTGEKSFHLVGEILAGGSISSSVDADACMRITTGAPLPPGADTVVVKENARIEGERIVIAAGAKPGGNVRPAGEEYRCGELALARGARLTPARLGVLASLGVARVAVARRPRVVLLTTGDELTAPGEPLGFGQIHDSNRFSLGALLESLGAQLLRHERVRDDPAALRDALLRAGGEADLIVSSGGVSAGEADFMPRLVADLGKVQFWKVRIKPGMPFLFGEVGAALLFALPGNPVSGFVTCMTLVRPALDAMLGASPPTAPLHARLRHAIDKRHARAEFQRARLEGDAHGVLWAMPHARQGSGMLRGVAEADALIVLTEGAREFAAGEVVPVLPLPGWPA